MNDCTSRETRAVQDRRICPDCGSPLTEGPHGGMSVNWYCINVRCGSRFNDTGPFGVERIDPMPNATEKKA